MVSQTTSQPSPLQPQPPDQCKDAAKRLQHLDPSPWPTSTSRLGGVRGYTYLTTVGASGSPPTPLFYLS